MDIRKEQTIDGTPTLSSASFSWCLRIYAPTQNFEQLLILVPPGGNWLKMISLYFYNSLNGRDKLTEF